jgi:hypothetical protein
VVASRPNSRGYRLDADGGRVTEVSLATTYLGGTQATAPRLGEAPAKTIAA